MNKLYRVGDQVKIVDHWAKQSQHNHDGLMDCWLGKTMTIKEVIVNDGDYHEYKMVEDQTEGLFSNGWIWYDNMIEGYAVQPKKFSVDDFEGDDAVYMCVETSDQLETFLWHLNKIGFTWADGTEYMSTEDRHIRSDMYRSLGNRKLIGIRFNAGTWSVLEDTYAFIKKIYYDEYTWEDDECLD